MSRIGKQPIPVPAGVDVFIEPELVRVKGTRGELEERVSRDMEISQEDGSVVVKRPTDRGEHRALHGLTRSLIANMILGVTEGFETRSRPLMTERRSSVYFSRSRSTWPTRSESTEKSSM